MIDLYIKDKYDGYLILAKKREYSVKRSCCDETVFYFFIKGKDIQPILLQKVYDGLLSYIDFKLLKNKEDIHIRILNKKIFDSFSKSRKSLGKIKSYLKEDSSSYNEWKKAFEKKNDLIKLLMKNKSSVNIIYDTLEDNTTLDVIKYMNSMDTQKMGTFANIEQQLKINDEKRYLLLESILRPISKNIEKTIQSDKKIESIDVYSDGGISIKGKIEEGHSYGSVIISIDKDGNEDYLIKMKGKLDLLKYSEAKHNVDFMELFSAYRSLIMIKDKILNGEIDKNIKVNIKMDNKSNIDIFNGLRDSKATINKLLWEEVNKMSLFMDISMEWVKGHDKNLMNVLADELVGEGRKMDKEGEVLLLNTEIVKRCKI